MMVVPAETIPDYLLIGHITRDLTPQGAQLGGTVSFAAHTAVAFGLKVGVLTSTQPNEPLLNDLPPEALVISIPAEHTTTFENRYDNGVRTQYMYHRAVTLTPEHVPPTWLRARLVHLGPIAYESDPTLIDVFDAETRFIATPQGYMREREPDGLVRAVSWPAAERVLPRTTLTVLSIEDIRHDPGLEHVFAQLAPLMVMTRAERGGTVYVNGAARTFEAHPFEQVDPTGAGDIFATALHIALDRLGDLDKALWVAAELAGRSVTRRGFASAPTPAEVAAALAAVQERA